MGLTAKTCTPCRGGIPPLTFEQAQAYLAEVPAWKLIDDATKIKRAFEFHDFALAMAFAQSVGKLCEEEGHHPDITFGWGYCMVIFYTHKIGGLHENDFIMAAKVDKLSETP